MLANLVSKSAFTASHAARSANPREAEVEESGVMVKP